MDKTTEQLAIAVVDLGCGDYGKGTTVDYLAAKLGAHLVVRASGAGQCGHNVVTPDGRHHCFAQVGSASFLPNVRTHLAKTMLVHPMPLVEECRALIGKGVVDIFDRLTVSAEAVTVTPFHRAANRLRELSRGASRHGSCGFGVGETVADSIAFPEQTIRAGDYRDLTMVAKRLRQVQARKRAELSELIRCLCEAGIDCTEHVDWLEDARWPQAVANASREFAERVRIVDEGRDGALGVLLKRRGTVLFEGAQGVLLDEWRGFHPYTTWSRCCNHNPYALLDEHGYGGERKTIGVLRAYATRHGAGPFVTEDTWLGERIPDKHNRTDDWQQAFRIGWIDFVATRYAIASCAHPVDELMLTCLDRINELNDDWQYCNDYDLSVLTPVEREELFRPDPVIPWFGRDIKLGPHCDLDYQARLTTVLGEIKPFLGTFLASYRTPENRFDEFADFVGELVKVPVKHLSYGVTREQKRSR